MNRMHLFMGCLAVVFYTSSVNASTKDASDKKTSLSLSLGSLNGEAKEYVYNDDTKLSEIKWKTNNAAIIKADASYSIVPWLDVNFYGWTTLASGGGSSTDRDWRDPDPDPANDTLNAVSNSPTTLNYANMFDVGLTGWLYQNEWSQVGLLAGYKESRFSWTAHDGYFQDMDDPSQNQKLSGSVTGYSQTYKAPYIGATVRFELQSFTFKTLFKYSNWVKSEDYDNHYLRKGFISTNKSNSSEMYSVSQEVAYDITSSFQVIAEAAWNRYEKTRADYSGKNESNETFDAPGAGGLSSDDYTLSAGVRYSF